ncbi:MAG TPA: hypothetical protein VNA14_10775 [Mycobacteriales bacterium]|nr:hypothetical protein [Mycobacteriales bacterium]
MRAPAWLLATAAAAALAAATWSARPALPASAPLVLAVPVTSEATPAPVDWGAVVRALDAARLDGYADPGSADPTRWLDPSCRCLAEERARLDRLMRAGHWVRAKAPEVRAVRAVSVTERRVVLDVTDALSAYDVVSAGGVVARYAGRTAMAWRGVLVRSAVGWRWADVAVEDHDPGPGVDRGEAG